MTSTKQALEFARRYETVQDLEGTFKLKHTDLDRDDLHALRFSGVIEKADFQMGKESLWTLTDEAERLGEEIEADEAVLVEDLDNEAVRMVVEHGDVFREKFPEETDETFISREVDIEGRTPEGLRRHDFIEVEERDKGYPTEWTITERTARVRQFLAALE